MINEVLVNIAKILFGIGIFFLFVKLFFKQKDNKSSEKINLIIFNMHKILFGLSTILGFVHGLSIVPFSQTYIITGWLYGILMILLCLIGVRLGFKNNWKPYKREEKVMNNKLILIKWVLTILVIISLGMHYLM